MELSDGDIEESNKILVGLDIAIIIPETDNQDLLELIDFKAKRVNKMKKKAERCWQRKINLTKITSSMAGDNLSSSIAFVYHPPLSFVISVYSTLLFPVPSDVSAGDALSSPINRCLLSSITSNVPISGTLSSIIVGYSSFLVTGDSPLSPILVVIVHLLCLLLALRHYSYFVICFMHINLLCFLC